MYREKTIPVLVKSIIQETPLVKRFTLVPADGNTLPAFSGGSHITTYIMQKDGVLARPYSLTNSPDDRESYQIAIRLNGESEGGSFYWHHHVQAGDTLYISYPKNYFPLSFRAKHHVFYAAGIGITPFLSMMAQLKDEGSSFELHYTSKSKDFCAFYDFLTDYYPKQCHFYFSKGIEPTRLTQATLLDHYIGTHVYFCGPENFISSFSEEAHRLGYPKSSIHYEKFTQTRAASLSPFTAELSNGQIIEVAKDQTLLNALLKEGIKVPYSCREGRCGTCEVRVREGEIEHYDSFLDTEQRLSNKVILTCISRAKTKKLVLDIP